MEFGEKIVRSFFCEITNNDARYQEIIKGFIANLDVEDKFCWFQHNGTIKHTAAPTMDFMCEFFDT